jgi:hypothetical protein
MGPTLVPAATASGLSVTSIADSPKLILAVARQTHTYQDASGLLEQVTSREDMLIPISVSLPRPEPPLH